MITMDVGGTQSAIPSIKTNQSKTSNDAHQVTMIRVKCTGCVMILPSIAPKPDLCRQRREATIEISSNRQDIASRQGPKIFFKGYPPFLAKLEECSRLIIDVLIAGQNIKVPLGQSQLQVDQTSRDDSLPSQLKSRTKPLRYKA